MKNTLKNLAVLIHIYCMIGCDISSSSSNNNYDYLLSKKVSIIIENTSKDGDVWVHYGEIKKRDDGYYFKSKKLFLNLNDEKLSKNKFVPKKKRKDLLKNTEYLIWLTTDKIEKPTPDMIKIGKVTE